MHPVSIMIASRGSTQSNAWRTTVAGGTVHVFITQLLRVHMVCSGQSGKRVTIKEQLHVITCSLPTMAAHIHLEHNGPDHNPLRSVIHNTSRPNRLSFTATIVVPAAIASQPIGSLPCTYNHCRQMEIELRTPIPSKANRARCNSIKA